MLIVLKETRVINIRSLMLINLWLCYVSNVLCISKTRDEKSYYVKQRPAQTDSRRRIFIVYSMRNCVVIKIEPWPRGREKERNLFGSDRSSRNADVRSFGCSDV